MKTLFFLPIAFTVLISFSACGSESGNSDSNSLTEGLEPEFIATQDRLLAAWDPTPYDESKDSFQRSASFDTYFKPVGVLTLSSSELIGRIDDFKVSVGGDVFVVDRAAKTVMMFSPDGSFNRYLSPEKCHPGYGFAPFEVAISRKGDILVTSNTSPAGFKFSADGDCVKAFEMHSWSPDGAILTEDGGAWVFNTMPNSYELIRVDEDGNKELLFSGNDYAPYNFRIKGGPAAIGSLTDSLIAFSLRQDPQIWVVSKKTGHVTKIGEVPEYYRPITEKLNPSLTSTEDLLSDFRRVSEGKSTTQGIQNLSPERLMVFFRNGYETFSTSNEGMGIQIINVSGEVLNNEPILFRGYLSGILSAGHGFLFRQSPFYDSGGDGIDQNPPIIVYKYVGR